MTVSLKYLPKLARRRLKKRQLEQVSLWPEQYVSSRTNSSYIPQNEQVRQFIDDDKPRYFLLKGGEGGGKSAAGIIKNLNRLRRGMSGIMVSTDLEHFKKSIWPTAKEWIPWQCVIERHRYRQSEGWEPSKAFTLTFKNEIGGFSDLICGGAKEDKIGSWEGPNVSFVHFDEARGHKTPKALKVFDGRIRILGAKGETPQLYCTTTPRKHWLFEYFAGAPGDEISASLVTEKIMVQYANFKRDAFVATVLTSENPNIDPEFVRQRAQTLDEAEARVLLQALWEDESDIEKFVNMIWWDNCQETSRPIGREPAIIALDAATGSENPSYLADCFAMVMVTRHLDRNEDVMIRYCGIWEAPLGQLLDFQPIEQELIRLCKEFSVLEVAYDPFQLHHMAITLKSQQIAFFKPFNQGQDRQLADKQFQDLIMARRIAHDGNPLLRQHIDNADLKKYEIKDQIRLIKRSASQKIDAAVALSMAASRCLYYNL